jgi:hypothetical protein
MESNDEGTLTLLGWVAVAACVAAVLVLLYIWNRKRLGPGPEPRQ